MYVSIRHYDGVRHPDEAAAKIRTEFLPIISKIPGFQDYYAVKTGSNAMTSVSVFKTRPGSDESVQAANKWVEKHLALHLPNAPQVMRGEAIAHSEGKLKRPAAA